MNSRYYLKVGFVTITLLNGNRATAYIREYTTANGVTTARTRVNNEFIQASWNGQSWSQVQG